MLECPICSDKLHDNPELDPSGGHKCRCERCGDFTAESMSLNLHDASRHSKFGLDLLCSGWVRSQNRLGTTPVVDGAWLNKESIELPTMSQRIEAYLQEAAAIATASNRSFDPLAPRLMAASYTDGKEELGALVSYLQKQNYLLFPSRKGPFEPFAKLTVEGRCHIESEASRRAKAMQGFVAMSFSKAMKEIYETAIKPAILDAGYEPIMLASQHYIGDIDDKIISEIRKSRFMVADLTEHRHNVYYEAGLATGLGLPVFYACREDEAAKSKFDVRQFNCIRWNKVADLEEQLCLRIQAVIGRGHAPRS